MNGKFGRKKFRDAWVAMHVKRGVATQLRSLRGTSSQASFGKKLGKPQPVVARLEDPNYGAMTVQTLLDIASKLDIGLLVKFVPFSRVLRETKNITSDDLAPLSYEAEVKAQRAISPYSIHSQYQPASEPTAERLPTSRPIDYKQSTEVTNAGSTPFN